MTDDLRERLAGIGHQIVGDYETDIIAEPIELAEAIDRAIVSCIEEYVSQLQPGDVLPNGWVAPDEATEEMIVAYEQSGPGAKAALRAMRAAAIREGEG